MYMYAKSVDVEVSVLTKRGSSHGNLCLTSSHGTCPLSDSCQYLALDGVYHPLWAALSNTKLPKLQMSGARL